MHYHLRTKDQESIFSKKKPYLKPLLNKRVSIIRFYYLSDVKSIIAIGLLLLIIWGCKKDKPHYHLNGLYIGQTDSKNSSYNFYGGDSVIFTNNIWLSSPTTIDTFIYTLGDTSITFKKISGNQSPDTHPFRLFGDSTFEISYWGYIGGGFDTTYTYIGFIYKKQ